MKRTQKGVSLVEVIVAIAVFSVISLTLFSAVIGLKSVVERQEEYVKLEMVCYDINAYFSKQTNESPWYQSYFKSQIALNDMPGIGYLKSDFSPTLDKNEAAYIIRFSKDVIISISDINANNIFVEGVKLPISEVKMNNRKKKDYVLAAVMILILIMTITVTSAFSLIMRYMFFAKSNLEGLGQSAESAYSYVIKEDDIDACI